MKEIELNSWFFKKMFRPCKKTLWNKNTPSSWNLFTKNEINQVWRFDYRNKQRHKKYGREGSNKMCPFQNWKISTRRKITT